jgi:hypothetical protein
MEKVVKTNLSKTDRETFAEFIKKYSGWNVIRYEDNSLEFIKPIKKKLSKK